MASRVIRWIANVVRDPYTEPAVHFHRGAESLPMVCDDPHCGRPHLDVGTG